jgi:hypothetical protein
LPIAPQDLEVCLLFLISYSGISWKYALNR